MSAEHRDNPKLLAAKGGAAGFTQIENSFARAEDLSPVAKLVGFVLATYVGRDGFAFPGLALLKADTGLGRDAVKRGKHELLEKGYAEAVRTRGLGGRFDRVKYRITAKVLHSSPKPEFQYRGQEPAQNGDTDHSTENPRTGGTVAGFTVAGDSVHLVRRILSQSQSQFERDSKAKSE